MKFTPFIFSVCSVVPCLSAIANNPAVKPLSEAEATAIVAAQEKAKEHAKDSREAKLKAAGVIETTVTDLGHRKIIFNRVKAKEHSSSIAAERQLAKQIKTISLPESDFSDVNTKETVALTISATVYEDGISELWWIHEGERYSVFTNADFTYFSGVGEFEDEGTHYSLFLVVGSQSVAMNPTDKWRPLPIDFSPDVLEYYIVDWGADMEAFKGIEALLHFYSENEEPMKIRYENRLKLQKARADYLKTHPPQANRDTIINFRPIE